MTDYDKIEKDFAQLLLQQQKRDELEDKMRAKIESLTAENERIRLQILRLNDFINYANNPTAQTQLDLLINDLIPKNKHLLLIQVRLKCYKLACCW